MYAGAAKCLQSGLSRLRQKKARKLVQDIRGDHEAAFWCACNSLVSNMIITGIPFELVRETRAPWNCKMAKVGSDKKAMSSAPRNNLRGGLVVTLSVLYLESKRGYRKEVDAIIQQVDDSYASPRILFIQGPLFFKSWGLLPRLGNPEASEYANTAASSARR